MNNEQAVVVTTNSRGVFFGYIDGDTNVEAHQETITLRRARNAIYWSADVKGFLGLAATGPTDACRIGPAVPALTLFGVTSVAKVTAGATERWETAQWPK
jgi:hypothetical protein